MNTWILHLPELADDLGSIVFVLGRADVGCYAGVGVHLCGCL